MGESYSAVGTLGLAEGHYRAVRHFGAGTVVEPAAIETMSVEDVVVGLAWALD